MGSSLSDVLLERLGRETTPKDEWPELVLAALEGEASVDALLAASAKPIGEEKSRISLKLWEIERKARKVTVWWGPALMKHRRPVPYGELQSKSSRFRSEAAAIRDEERRIGEQVAQGYERRPSKKF